MTDVPTGSERRVAERFTVRRPVSIRRPGSSSVRGILLNISLTGAAVHIQGWNVADDAPWPTMVGQGDEVWLTGLLNVPLACWAIAVDDGVLRVRFLRDPGTQAALRDLIANTEP
jgi:hypothetical protein